jgi:hypothetical protein
MRLHPQVTDAALLIRRCRGFMAPDNGLAEISEMVALPLNPSSQMIAATALALLLNTPFLYVESDGRECQVTPIEAATVAQAHQSFEDYCSERFPVTG